MSPEEKVLPDPAEKSVDLLSGKRIIQVGNNSLQLMTESRPYLTSLIDDIKQAKQRVWIESYTIVNDELIEQLAEAICERARAGIDCRLTYDAVGSFLTPGTFFQRLEEAGVQVHVYRPFRVRRWHLSFLRRFFQAFNRRNHRKLVVIDQHVSYFGGMNLVDLGGSTSSAWSKANPYPSQAWRDVHVRLEGEATEEVAAAFLALRPERANQAIPKSHGSNNSTRQILAMSPESIRFVDCRPHVKYRRPAPVFRTLLRSAKTQIRLAMAYFLPFGGVLKELRRAHRRKVKVEVILPRVSDVPVVQWATQHMYQRLLQSGVEIYERNDQMLHSKAIVIDDHLSVVGSCNFDPRSFLLNLEFFAIIHSPAFAEHLSSVLGSEIENSRKVSLESHQQRSWFRRTLHWIAWRFRRWL